MGKSHDIATIATDGLPTSGSIIQMAGDTYNSSATFNVTTSVNNSGQLGSNLQVQIPFRSTSNKFHVKCFIPDIYNQNVPTRYLHAGFRYSTDGFSSHSATFGEREYISDYIGYKNTTGAVLMSENYETFGSVPATGTITIRPYLIAGVGVMTLNANAIGVYCLTVMEIKG
jgi:hypothetical protein